MVLPFFDLADYIRAIQSGIIDGSLTADGQNRTHQQKRRCFRIRVSWKGVVFFEWGSIFAKESLTNFVTFPLFKTLYDTKICKGKEQIRLLGRKLARVAKKRYRREKSSFFVH